MPSLPDHIKDRKVVQWTLAYLAGAWLLYEALSLVSQNFALPPVFIRAVSIVLAIGLPVAIVVAWYHGEKGQQRVTGIELGILTALLLIGAIGMTVLVKPRMHADATAASTKSSDSPATHVDPKSVAVLPLSNFSDDQKDTYFADGMHDEILTQLSKLHDLKVISRTSVLQYREGTRNLREIGQQLGVAAVLEGSVRRAGNKVRVTVQLINAGTDEHIWADDYDGTLDDVFAIQDSIARAIASALQAQLSSAESERLDERLTRNNKAYDLYLQARAYQLRPTSSADNLLAAEQLFERAVAADPKFAAAYAQLSRVNSALYWYAFDKTPARLQRARQFLDRAIALRPDLPEVNLAAGFYYYWSSRDYTRALPEFQKVVQALPNSSEARAAIAYIARRRGQWDETIAGLEQVTATDPRNADLFRNLGETFDALGRFPEADRELLHAITLAPDFHSATVNRANLYIRWHGTTDSMRAVLQRVPAAFEPTVSLIQLAPRVKLAMFERRYDDALRAVNAQPNAVLEHQRRLAPRSLIAAQVFEVMGNSARARLAYDSARVALEAMLRTRPNDPRVYSALGRVYAGLGRNDDAIRYGRRAVQLLPISLDAWDGPSYAQDLAAIYAHAGHTAEAVNQLRVLLRTPAGPTSKELAIDPEWDPIRNDPGFKALLRS